MEITPVSNGRYQTEIYKSGKRVTTFVPNSKPATKQPPKPAGKEKTEDKFDNVYTIDGKGALRSVYVNLTNYGLEMAGKVLLNGVGLAIVLGIEFFVALFGYNAGNGFKNIEKFKCPNPKGTRSTYNPNPLANGQTLEKQQGKLKPAPKITDENKWFIQSRAYVTYQQLVQSRKLFFGILSLTAAVIACIPALLIPFTILGHAISTYGNTEVYSDKINYAYYYVYVDGFNSTMSLTIFFDKYNDVIGRTDPLVITN